MDVLREAPHVEVGISITTADEDIRRIFEPRAPSIKDRIRALDELHRAGIRTFAMIAPLLPKAQGLAELLEGKVDHVLVDRMNYNYGDWVYRKYKMEDQLADEFFRRAGNEIWSAFTKQGVDCQVIFAEE
jgi:DNA repair photolyase